MKTAGSLVLVVMMGLSSGTAAAQQCSSRFALAALTSEAAQVAGKSDTWRDLLARLVADVESLDLEQGDAKTTLTWNVTPNVDAQVVAWRQPTMFDALVEALASNEQERNRLSGKIREGDDWEASIAGHWGIGIGGGDGVATWGFARYYKSLANQAANVDKVSSTAYGLDCDQLVAVLPHEAIEAQGRLLRDPDNPPHELSFRLFARQRHEVVGPDRLGVTVKYTFGIPPKKEDQRTGAATDSEDLKAARGLLGLSAPLTPIEQRSVAALAPYLDRVTGNSRHGDVEIQAALAGPAITGDDAARRDAAAKRAAFRNLAGNPPPAQSAPQHRLAFELDWQRVEDYEFTASAGPLLVLPEEESLIIKGSYSLQLSRDGATDPASPLYELSASYEDVDGDAQRQNRLLASATAVMRVSALGKDSDLTFGLHYASKPEYLVLGDYDRGLTARLAMTFKVGAPPSIGQ